MVTARQARAGLIAFLTLGVALGALCLTPVQTAVFNAWAKRTDLPFVVESARFGWSGFELADLNLRTSQGSWRFPKVAGRFRLGDIVGGNLRFQEIQAIDWSLVSPEEDPAKASPLKRGDEILKSGAERFRSLLDLGRPVSVDRLNLEGEWRRHANDGVGERTHIRATIRGSVKAGVATKVDLQLWASETDRDGQSVEVNARGTLAAHYASETRINRLVLSATASAIGQRLPNGAVLSTRLDLRANDKDTTLDLHVYGSGDSDSRELLVVSAGTEVGTGAMKGSWTIDLNHTDVAPYLIGIDSPLFSVKGGGAFAFDRSLRIAGDAEGEISYLPVINGRAAIPRTAFRGVGDATYHEGEWLSHRLNLRLKAGNAEVAAQALQPITWRIGGKLSPLNPDGDLLQAEWRGVGSSVLQDYGLHIPAEFEPCAGGVFVSTRDNTLDVRLVRPLHLEGLRFALPGFPQAPLRAGVEGRVLGSAQSVHVDISRVDLSSPEKRILWGEIKSTLSLATDAISFAATGAADMDLTALAYLRPGAPSDLRAGLARVEATVTGTTSQWQAETKIQVIGATTSSGTALPLVTTTARLDRSTNGSYDAELPLNLTLGRDVSDLTVLSHWEPLAEGWRIDTLATSRVLHLQHLRSLGSLVSPSAAKGDATTRAAFEPFWNGLRGRFRVGLQQILLPQRTERAALQLEANLSKTALIIDSLQFDHEAGGRLNGKAEVHHDPRVKHPYQFAGWVEAYGLDPGPYLRFLDPTRPPHIEGKFDMEVRAKGQVSTLADIADASELQVNLTGRGGIFRGFDRGISAVDFSKPKDTGSTISNLLEIASSLIGRQERRVAEAASFLGHLANLSYDQATFELRHKPGLDTEIREFSLIAPELRFRGSGFLQANALVPWAERYVNLELNVAARGQRERELRALGLIGDQADTLGYFPHGRPLRFEGTLRDLKPTGLVDVISQALAK